MLKSLKFKSLEKFSCAHRVVFSESWERTRAYSGHPHGAMCRRAFRRDQYQLKQALGVALASELSQTDAKVKIKYSAILDPAYRHTVGHNHEFNELLHAMGCFRSNFSSMNWVATDRQRLVLYGYQNAQLTTPVLCLSMITINEQDFVSGVQHLIIKPASTVKSLPAKQMLINQQALMLNQRVEAYPEILTPDRLKACRQAYQQFRRGLRYPWVSSESLQQRLVALKALLQPCLEATPLKLLIKRNDEQTAQLNKIADLVDCLSVLEKFDKTSLQASVKHMMAIKRAPVLRLRHLMAHLMALEEEQQKLDLHAAGNLAEHDLVKACVELLTEREAKRIYRRLTNNRWMTRLLSGLGDYGQRNLRQSEAAGDQRGWTWQLRFFSFMVGKDKLTVRCDSLRCFFEVLAQRLSV